jgi:hypothetical protein
MVIEVDLPDAERGLSVEVRASAVPGGGSVRLRLAWLAASAMLVGADPGRASR